MKKIMMALVLIGGITVAFSGVKVDAAGIETYMTPTKFTQKTHLSKQIKISTDKWGPSIFYFNPGNGQGERSLTGEFSRTFSQYWTSNSISYYTYSGRVTNADYGPGKTVYGKATITAN